MKNTLPRLLAAAAACAAATAQDIILPLGFGSSSGPPANSYPVARAKDKNGDGFADATETVAFVTQMPSQAASGTHFMTDGRMVVENGEPAFYFTDSEDGQVIRGQDRNHNGVLDPSEIGVFFRFGTTNTGAGLFAPDTLGVYRDPQTNRTRAYVALDSTNTAFPTRGIYRLVDLNDDGDATDPGEQNLFVSASLGLTVPGLNGPVAITRDFWSCIRVLPGGKVVAFASGGAVVGTLVPGSNPPAYTYTVQPEMNCWYGFTDNNGTAVPEVWFNGSALNALPMHPDFDDPRVPVTRTFPNWDIQVQNAATPTRRCFARFMDVVPAAGFAAIPTYYLFSSYNVQGQGNLNLNGQPVAGLIYKVTDTNLNDAIDAGELTLYANLSGQTYAGVAPVTFVNAVNNLPVTVLNDRPWGFAASQDDVVSFLYDNGGVFEACVSMFDSSANGIIDQGEVTMAWYAARDAAGYLPPLSLAQGAFLDDFLTLGVGLLPGPFPTGVAAVGTGCIGQSRRLEVVMDAWNGAPQVGNGNFTVGALRGPIFQPGFVLADFQVSPLPQPLGPLGLPSACTGYLANPVTLSFAFSNQQGILRQPAGLPNDPTIVGLTLAFQCAMFDAALPSPVPFVTTNALQVTIQP